MATHGNRRSVQQPRQSFTAAEDRKIERNMIWMWFTLVVVLAPAMNSFLVNHGGPRIAAEVNSLASPMDPYGLLKILRRERKNANSRLRLAGISIPGMEKAFDGRIVLDHNEKGKLLTDSQDYYTAWADLARAMQNPAAETQVRRHKALLQNPSGGLPPPAPTSDQQRLLLAMSSLFHDLVPDLNIWMDNNGSAQALRRSGRPHDPQVLIKEMMNRKRSNPGFLPGVPMRNMRRALLGRN